MVESFTVIQFMYCCEDRLFATRVDQLSPLSVERHRPAAVPAKSFVPLTARVLTRFWYAPRPLFTAVQLAPLSVDRKMPLPPYVPAKISVSFTKHKVKLLFTFVQLAPLSVDRNIPASVPTKTSEPITVTTFILPAEPALTCFHCALSLMADRCIVIVRQRNNNNLFIVISFSFDYRFN